jgi:hypothetical protein
MSERQLFDLTGNNSENPTLDVPSRYVFSRSHHLFASGRHNIHLLGFFASGHIRFKEKILDTLKMLQMCT